MFPGLTTRLSTLHASVNNAGVLDCKADVAIITATDANLIAIKPHFGGLSGIQYLLNQTGSNIQLAGGGNIAGANGSKDLAQNVLYTAVYIAEFDEWFISDAQVAD